MSAERKNSDQYDVLFKIVLSGDTAVGKTNILSRYTEDEFFLESKSTIGVEFGSNEVIYKNKILKAQIWDTAGQERYKALTTSYYRGAHGALIVFDLTNRASFEHVQDWYDEIKKNSSSASLILIGNKSDLKEQRKVSEKEARSFAENKKMLYIETSALEGTNIDDSFTKLITDIYDIGCKEFLEPVQKTIITESEVIRLDKDTLDNKKKKNCCSSN